MEQPPVLPRAQPHDSEQRARALSSIRRFHVGVSAPEDAGHDVETELFPALMFAYRDPSLVRDEFPVFLPFRPAVGASPCTPLPELMTSMTEGRSTVVVDNLKRAERAVRELCAERGGRTDAGSLLIDVGEALRAELDLPKEQDERFAAEWRSCCQGIPPGEMVALDERTPLWLLLAAARQVVPGLRESFHEKVASLRDGLRSLLDVERRKDPGSQNPASLSGALGSAGDRLLDPGALAKALGPHRGTRRLDDARRNRLGTALAALESFLDAPPPALVVAIGEGSDLQGIEDLDCATAADGCAEACRQFDEVSAQHADLFRAVRIAELELEGHYDPTRHDPWLSGLDWEGFTKDELLLLPRFVVLDTAEQLSGDRLTSLSTLLRSGRPVQVIAHVAPGENPADPSVSSFRLELGYVGIGHREAFVQQSTAARPEHLARGFARGLSGTRSALHVVATGLTRDGGTPRLGAWMHTGAAIEGRAHPLFRYDPEAGVTWARRLEFDGNPAPEEDWPTGTLTYRDDGGDEAERSLTFTFVDYALLEPTLRAEFRPVEDSEDEALVTVDEYLGLEVHDAAHRLPFVWAIDSSGSLRQLAVTRRLVAACRDRLDFWRTLQELAGVRNEHVREAVARARDESEARAREERERLQAEHEAEIARVREEAFGEAMQGLANSLLELGPDALELTASPRPPAADPAAPAAAPSEPEAEPEVAEVPEPEPAAPVYEEAWIDTPLCTSCNDCCVINPLVFVYDENKQARIGDLSTATFAQLVQAAEKCPARCIHPGSPMNPDEPDLEALIARAAPFNG